jgi:hypothetical protein
MVLAKHARADAVRYVALGQFKPGLNFAADS